jgi:ribosomal protein S18 acetylase RimI-like enzyme
LISYRSFRNSDTPLLVEVWRAQPPTRGLAQPVSVEIFEQIVLAKPYFENKGLILALDDGKAAGFVHAGFGPSDDGTNLNCRFGVTSLLLARPDYQQTEIGPELLARSEKYLRERGAQVLYAGGIRPLDPFYLGLYGGSELPGVLASDLFSNRLYQAAGYAEIDRVIVLERELAGFRPPVDRVQMQIRRGSVVEEMPDAAPRNWWEACALEHFQLIAFNLAESTGAASVGTARFWTMDTFAAGWGAQAAGLYDLEVTADRRRHGIATFLVSDALRRLAAQGIALVEVQTMAENAAALALYRKLGFREVDQGIVYRRQFEKAR